VTVRLKSGIATEPGLPQTLFRLGGINTVRGFEYGVRQAPAFWAAQADLTLLPGRFRPVVFLDVGQAAATRDLFSSEALVGIGAGLALLRGLIRCDLSRPLSPNQDRKLRFDLVLQGAW
jgi:hemolysin activation/secretion protein